MKRLFFYGTLCLSTLSAQTERAKIENSINQTSLTQQLHANWPKSAISNDFIYKFLSEELFYFGHNNSFYSLTPQENSPKPLAIQTWWKNVQTEHANDASLTKLFTQRTFNHHRLILVKNLYQIYIMPPCKKNGIFYNVDLEQAIDILAILLTLLATNSEFRHAVSCLRFQADPRFIINDHPTPFFVICACNGKKDAQTIINTLAKNLPFKSLKGYIYLTPPHSIVINAKKFPGISYAQDDSDFKNRLVKWRDEIYDINSNYALFNPLFVGIKSTRELQLAIPKKKIVLNLSFFSKKKK